MKLRPVLAALVAPVLLAGPLSATWSIVLVDTRTKEVAIGSATCLTGLDLRVLTPILVVGKGGGAAQSFVDSTGRNRLLIFNEFQKGTAPATILQLLANQDSGHQTRQYGIVDTQGRAVTFTGTGAGAWAGGKTGQVGTIVYAVQGNVLTGAPVVDRAVQAIQNSTGDLATRLMVAMEAAYSMGGDGRCSCGGNPTGCGSPPPSFTKSAHIGYMLIARLGDTDGTCNPNVGCGSGSYYMELNVANASGNSADPVRQLRLAYDYWRIALQGHPDHHLSTVELDTPGLPADGTTAGLVTVRLRDLDGAPISSAATVTAALDPSSSASVSLGPVRFLGSGVYSFPVVAGTTAGIARLRIEADDGRGKVLLSPNFEITVSGDPLWASRAALSTTSGGVADFVLRTTRAGRAYVLAASNSGSSPGIKVGANLVVPVNPDPFFVTFLEFANRPPITNKTIGTFDATGNANASFGLPPNVLAALKGTKLTFAFATFGPIDFASNAVTVELR
ncbi:MAG: DUF1028 domain-containing protein [Planctomycetes bacterium]|nr:DUF1028 domain-containing protein [Planctomycetota bacterium]